MLYSNAGYLVIFSLPLRSFGENHGANPKFCIADRKKCSVFIKHCQIVKKTASSLWTGLWPLYWQPLYRHVIVPTTMISYFHYTHKNQFHYTRSHYNDHNAMVLNPMPLPRVPEPNVTAPWSQTLWCYSDVVPNPLSQRHVPEPYVTAPCRYNGSRYIVTNLCQYNGND